MLVADASKLVPALADDGTDGTSFRRRLSGERLAAPELIDLEVCSVLRRLAISTGLSAERARTALTDLGGLPLRRASHTALRRRCWEMRDTIAAYDASYVALAEALGAVLVTADRRLAHASGPRCRIEVLPASG